MKRTTAVFWLMILAVITVSCRGTNTLPQRTLIITTADGTEISVTAEIAKKAEDRNRGYMERQQIPEGTGMLFVFEKDQILSFWMKNTPSPLSIAYIDSRGIIRDIFDMTPFSLANVTSTRSVRYALEVPQGWFKKMNINTGDQITIPSDL